MSQRCGRFDFVSHKPSCMSVVLLREALNLTSAAVDVRTEHVGTEFSVLRKLRVTFYMSKELNGCD